MKRILLHVLFAGSALATLAAAFQAAPGIVKKVRADFAFVQTNAPVQVMGLRSTVHDFAEQVHVANVAAKKVVRLQLGWTVDGCGKSPARASFLGLPMDLDLAPGAWTSAGRQGITPTDVYRVLNQFQESCGEIQVGGRIRPVRRWNAVDVSPGPAEQVCSVRFAGGDRAAGAGAPGDAREIRIGPELDRRRCACPKAGAGLTSLAGPAAPARDPKLQNEPEIE